VHLRIFVRVMITNSESCAEDRPVTLEMGARDLVLPDPAPILGVRIASGGDNMTCVVEPFL
jgi:hypothetical protein